VNRYSADLLYQAQMAFFDALEVNNETLHGIEAVVQLAFAAGREAAFEGGETEWHAGTDALVWLAEPEQIARARAAWRKSGGFLEMRRLGPWVRIEGEVSA
jgi:hypothetical protein